MTEITFKYPIGAVVRINTLYYLSHGIETGATGVIVSQYNEANLWGDGGSQTQDIAAYELRMFQRTDQLMAFYEDELEALDGPPE